MTRLLKPGDVAYDVGANFGIHTLLMARLVGASGRVYGFEPHPRIHTDCVENIRLNAFDNVEILKLALSDRSGNVSFSAGHHDGAGHIASADEGASLTVSCDTIDHLTAGGLRHPNFLKVDVEGHAAEVLSGAQNTFANHRPLLCVDLHDPSEDEAVGKFLLALEYEAFHQDSLRKISRLDLGWPAADGIHGTVLAIPAETVHKTAWLQHRT